jgi:hypothetical protein
MARRAFALIWGDSIGQRCSSLRDRSSAGSGGIEVSDAELAHLPEEETARFAVLSHTWASRRHAPEVRAVGPEGASTEVVAYVAEPGPLIAMKLQSVMDRTVNKERTDARWLRGSGCGGCRVR